MSRKKAPSSVTELSVFPMRLQELMEREPRTTQPQLAKALGIQRQTVSNYANGQSSPDWKTLAAIADYFHVSADWLLGRTETESPDPQLQAVCSFLGINEAAAFQIMKISNAAEAINDLAAPPLDEYPTKKELGGAPLLMFANSFMAVKKAAALAGAKIIPEVEVKTHIEAQLEIEKLELALLRFDKVCKKLPQIYFADMFLEMLNETSEKLYCEELQKFMEDSKDGKHKIDGN